MSDEEGMDGGSHDNVTIKVPLLSLNEHTGMYECMYVCMYVCIHVCIHVCRHVYVCI